jgi:glucokinase
MTNDSSAPYPRLVGDVGGTHARFGWIATAGAAIGHVATYDGEAYPDLQAAIAHYLGQRDRAPASCAIGIATPVLGDSVTMTNRDWSFSIRALKRRIGCERLVVLNDFAALALSLSTLGPRDLLRVGGTGAAAEGTVALLGPGTGLGVAGLLATPAGLIPIVGEGGHITLGASDGEEDRLLAALRQRFGHVSAERALSGPGLVNLHRAICELRGQAAAPLDAPAITAAALDGSDPSCEVAIDAFFAFLGTVAGDLALTLGARGGVYVGGGIVPQLGDAIGRSRFRERFESKGRCARYLEAIPVWVITSSEPVALHGADRALDARVACGISV